jgi:hypothetical protein
MKIIKEYGLFILSIVLTILGYLELKYSVREGVNATDDYVIFIGGSIDSSQYDTIQSSFILANIVIGGILFAVGLTFLCFSVYKILKKDG